MNKNAYICSTKKDLTRRHSQIDTRDKTAMNAIFDELLGSHGGEIWIAPPFHVDYGENIHLGKNVEINMNCVFLNTAPVTIGKNVWIGGGSIILPGVTIGDNTTIGAGSVVSKDIPANCLAVGNPCRVIRQLSE